MQKARCYLLLLLVLMGFLFISGCTEKAAPQGLGILLLSPSQRFTQVIPAQINLNSGKLSMEEPALYTFITQAGGDAPRYWDGERALVAATPSLLLDYPTRPSLVLADLPAQAVIGEDTIGFPVPAGGLLLYNWDLTPPGVRLNTYLTASADAKPIEVGRNHRPIALAYRNGQYRAAFLLRSQSEVVRWAVSLWQWDGQTGQPDIQTLLMPNFAPETLPVPAAWVGEILYVHGVDGLTRFNAGTGEVHTLGSLWEGFAPLSPSLSQYEPLPGAHLGAWGDTLVYTLPLGIPGQEESSVAKVFLLVEDAQVQGAILYNIQKKQLITYAGNGKRLADIALPASPPHSLPALIMPGDAH